MAKRNHMPLFYVIAAVTVVVAVIAIAKPYIFKVDLTPLLPIEELSTKGYTEVNFDVATGTNNGVVILQGGCYRITASTENSQVESILNGANGLVPTRPNMHDVFRDTLQNLKIDIVMIKVDGIKDNNFIGKMILKQGNRIISLDSRPSDGMAMSARTDAPIYVNNSILREQGKYIC